jgi:hypothetical protein
VSRAFLDCEIISCTPEDWNTIRGIGSVIK